MRLVNADKYRYKGLWTKEQAKEKSVIDYVITNTEYLNNIKEMIIHETKEYVTYRLDQQNQNLKKTYSNLNVILLKIDFHTENIQTKEPKLITKGYKEYRENFLAVICFYIDLNNLFLGPLRSWQFSLVQFWLKLFLKCDLSIIVLRVF